jgi:hypothetical protein
MVEITSWKLNQREPLPDSPIQPKARGLPHMECDFSIAHHRHEHLITSMQPRKYSKKNFKTELQRKSKTILKVLEKAAVLSYEELGGLSDPVLWDYVHNVV